MNDFRSDDRWQREVRDRVLVPHFYEKHFAGRYRFADGEMNWQRKAVDTLLSSDDGTIRVEEKIVRWPGFKYTAFALETDSCTLPGLESPGWMQYGEADRLLYCFALDEAATTLECWWLKLQVLKEWFWPLKDNFNVFRMPTQNRTRGRVVPIEDVKEIDGIEWRKVRCPWAS